MLVNIVSPLPPSSGPMEEFANWSNNNNLVHIPTSGAKVTWSNGSNEANNTQKR